MTLFKTQYVHSSIRGRQQDYEKSTAHPYVYYLLCLLLEISGSVFLLPETLMSR